MNDDKDPVYEVLLAFMKAANVAMVALIIVAFSIWQALESFK